MHYVTLGVTSYQLLIAQLFYLKYFRSFHTFVWFSKECSFFGNYCNSKLINDFHVHDHRYIPCSM